jgi:DNA-binding NarL/FixJ family response regulator
VGVGSELAQSYEIVGEAATAPEAIEVITAERPDVVLLDVHLPEGGGVAVLTALAQREDAPAFLALSASDAAADVIEIVRAGARGYVTKTIPTEDLVAAIAQVAAGDAYFSAKSSPRVTRSPIGRRRAVSPTRPIRSSRRARGGERPTRARSTVSSPVFTPCTAEPLT